jgi:phosphoglycolate phosphatase-like HAD superfamily hydrolase
MQIIKAVLFEPVGCLAEFPAEEFNDIAASVFDSTENGGQSGSGAYWRLLDLMQKSEKTLSASEASFVERLELRAVERVELYEDVAPSLAELKAMSVTLVIASSLSGPAVSRFLDKFSLNGFFSSVWTRDNAEGVKTVPLAKALESTAVRPEHVMLLVDTVDSLEAAKAVGANSMLMINDYDEGRKLAMRAPTGGIVSLHELPDAIRFVAEKANLHP